MYSKPLLAALTAAASGVCVMHVSKNSTLGLSSAAFQEPYSATPYNKFPLASQCPGTPFQLLLYFVTMCIISTKLNNVVSLTLDDLHLMTREGSSHQGWKSIFPLSLCVLRPSGFSVEGGKRLKMAIESWKKHIPGKYYKYPFCCLMCW